MPFSSASPGSTKYSVSASPTRIQEGLNTSINVNLQAASANTTYTFKVNVTSPSVTSYFAYVTVATDETGSGSNTTEFWRDFANANTDFVGTYSMALYNLTGNAALATSNFTVGLTDKLKYVRSETVSFRGSGYMPNETVTVEVKFGSTSVYTKNVTASQDGLVVDSWIIPEDIMSGVYRLTLTNATTSGTVKSPSDAQDFTVENICEIQTRNLANETVAGATVEVYNTTSSMFLNLSQQTNKTGWSKFLLDAGNFTFKAFWKNVEAGTLNQSIEGNVILLFQVSLSNIQLTIKDEAYVPLPFIDLSLKYNYTTRANKTISATDSFITGINGTVRVQNLFTNISYLIETRRYGFLFNTTSIKSLPALPWSNITIIAPTYTLFVQVLDSKGAPAAGLNVKAYDWSSGIGGEALQSAQTDSSGNVTLSLTIGRYKLRLYNDTTFLDEVTVDLKQDPSFFVIHSNVYKVDLHVLVVDYFGQPIPNAYVELQRKNNSNYETSQANTESNGVASFNGIIGGDSRIYVSVAGRPGETRYLYLVGPATDVVFKMDEYVAIAGYALETSQFVTMVVVLIIIVAFIVVSTYKRLPRFLRRLRK